MACYHPTPAAQGSPGEAVQLWPPLGAANLYLPCGTCVGCRSDKALEWSCRCQHEASLWRFNSFVTLTYDDEHCPRELRPVDLQRWLKRLRIAVSRKGGQVVEQDAGPLRFFACGEYGETTDRPHYHVLLFNCRFRDRVKEGKDLFSCGVLSETWTGGAHRFGDANVGAVATYIGKYALKAMYEPPCDADGVVRQRPFLRCSTRPGIGAEWLSSFKEDLKMGYVVVDGQPRGIPRYYIRKLSDSKVKSDNVLSDVARARAFGARACGEVVDLVAAEKIHMRRNQLLSEVVDVPF